jgi:SRSO17 transposase
LIEWPEGDAEPLKYFLSPLPGDRPIEHLVYVTKMRWLIERDYRELKQEFGLGHYEGRNWRGCITMPPCVLPPKETLI